MNTKAMILLLSLTKWEKSDMGIRKSRYGFRKSVVAVIIR